MKCEPRLQMSPKKRGIKPDGTLTKGCGKEVTGGVGGGLGIGRVDSEAREVAEKPLKGRTVKRKETRMNGC